MFAQASFTVTAQVNVAGSAFAHTLPGWTAAYQPTGDLAAFSNWSTWARVMRGDNGQSLAEWRAGQDCDARTNQGSGPFCYRPGQPGPQSITLQRQNNALPCIWTCAAGPAPARRPTGLKRWSRQTASPT